MSNRTKELAAAIIKSVKERTGRFLDENVKAREFLEDRAKRMAELLAEYATADEIRKKAIEREMSAVTLAIETESINIALDVDSASRAWWADTVKTVFATVKEFAIPFIRSLVG